MSPEQPQKRVIARIVQPRKRTTSNVEKASYCNSFNLRFTTDEVVLNFGFDEGKTSVGDPARQVPISHKIILSVATGRRLSRALEAALRPQAKRQPRVSVQIKPAKKLN